MTIKSSLGYCIFHGDYDDDGCPMCAAEDSPAHDTVYGEVYHYVNMAHIGVDEVAHDLGFDRDGHFEELAIDMIAGVFLSAPYYCTSVGTLVSGAIEILKQVQAQLRTIELTDADGKDYFAEVIRYAINEANRQGTK
jgi:hypothetical protein